MCSGTVGSVEVGFKSGGELCANLRRMSNLFEGICVRLSQDSKGRGAVEVFCSLRDCSVLSLQLSYIQLFVNGADQVQKVKKLFGPLCGANLYLDNTNSGIQAEKAHSAECTCSRWMQSNFGL